MSDSRYHPPRADLLPSTAGDRASGGLPSPALPSGDPRRFFCVHRSDSMYPLLRDFDVLEVLADQGRPIRRGDVVVFPSPVTGSWVVHRVVGRTPAGYTTWGDHCEAPDPWHVAPETIRGRVVAVWRGNRRRSLHGGWAGLLVAWTVRVAFRVKVCLAPWLRRPYRRLAESGILRRWLPATLRPRIVSFGMGSRAQKRVLMGHRVAAWQDPAGGEWHFRFPYVLFVDRRDIERLDVAGVGFAPPSPPRRLPLGEQLLSPEMRLLLAVCAAEARADAVPDAILPRTDAAVTAALRLAEAHGVVGLAARGILRCAGRTEADARALKAVRLASLTNSARNLALLQETAAVSGRLARAGIRHAPFKGPALGEAAFGDACVRVSWDVDILVDERDIRRARRLFEEAGYRPTLAIPAAAEEAYVRSQGEFGFSKAGFPFEIELVCRPAPAALLRSLDFDDLWAHACADSIAEHPFTLISVEDHLLLASIHATKHGWDRLSHIVDVGGLCSRHPDLDWNRLLRLASRLGAKRMVGLGLWLALRLLDCPLPDAARRWIENDSRLADMGEAIIRRLGNAEGLGPSAGCRMIRFQLQARERVCDRLRHVALLAFVPSYSDWCWVRLPRALFPLYYLLRPARLSLKAMRRLTAQSSGCPPAGA